MNLSDSKKKLVLAGVVCGIVAWHALQHLEIQRTWHSVLHVLSVIRREQWECIRQKWYSMQDRRLLVLYLGHLSFQ